jgi:hypothetical protein
VNNSGSPSESGARTLLFVHGRDFKPSAEDFMDLTISALSAGLERDCPELLEQLNSMDKRLAYYGDVTDDFLTSQGLRYDETLDIGDRRNALIQLKGLDKKKSFSVNRYDRLPGKTAITEFAADVIAPLLGGLGFSKKLIKKVGIDLAEYWNEDSNFADQIRQRVRSSICEALDSEKQILLISHGTGCIVTYDVLWELSHSPEYKNAYESRKVDLWLTMGAPLGDSMVRRRILGARKKGIERYPSNIVSWHNLSAEDDFVSHDNTLADDYKDMLKQKQVSCIRDYRIYNMCIRYGKSNPHSSLGYLIHPRTAQIVSDWLQQGAAAPLPKNIL